MSALPDLRRWRGARPIAAAWGLSTLMALAALQGAPGVSRDEAAVLASTSARGTERPAGPPLAAWAAAITHAAGAAAGVGHVRAYRLGTAVAGAVLSALLALAAWQLAGPAAAALAPALFWLAPRTLHAGLVATPDLALAALALAAVLAWRRACAAESRARAAWAAGAGVLLGAAVLARADAWTLAIALAVHVAGARALARRGAGAGGAAGKLGIALGAGAAVVLVAWPALLRSGAAPSLPPPGGIAAPALALAALPAPILFAFAGGLVHAFARIREAFRSGPPADGAPYHASSDVLLAAAAVAALAGSTLVHAPAGARPFLHALPFLALLGARALIRAAELAWPARRGALEAALALLVLYPGLRAAVASFPDGAAAWNELAGGAPGGASRGLRRQDGGEAVAALLREVSARAAPGARIWWPGAAAAAVELYARDGRLRADLVPADGPEDADLAVVPLDGGSRDAEYRAWGALRTARPSSGAYLDEVPIAFVYARPGAWR